VIHAHAHWGEHLPGWHPWEDYRAGYSARRDLGGGVLLTLCHPLDYLRWLLGPVSWVSATSANSGFFGIDVEEMADLTLGFVSGARAGVHLDFAQRPPSHYLQITGRAGLIRWDNADGIAHCYRAKDEAWETAGPASDFERNTLFLDEISAFCDWMAGVRETAGPAATLADGLANLRLILAAHRSAGARGRVMELD
jgi:predicted dehydrogenase